MSSSDDPREWLQREEREIARLRQKTGRRYSMALVVLLAAVLVAAGALLYYVAERLRLR